MYFTALQTSHFQQYRIINFLSNGLIVFISMHVYFVNKQKYILIIYDAYTGRKYNHTVRRRQNKYLLSHDNKITFDIIRVVYHLYSIPLQVDTYIKSYIRAKLQ